VKEAALDHPKMHSLALALGVPRVVAIGLVERLIHFSLDYCPHGTVGKWADKEIAYGCSWTGNPKEFITALLSTGWLLRQRQFRFVLDLSLPGSGPQRVRLDRMKLYRSHVSKTKRLLVFTRDRWACQICQTTSDLTIDHVKPVALGGSGAIENLQTLCRPCNSRKKDRYALGVSA
jgi:hypothetical protein